jgi:lipid-A-disaccharide synthase
MISCGEPSGDVYAAALASEIKRLEPGAVVSGFGGSRLRGAGAALAGDFSGLSVTGLTEALRVLPRSWRLYRRLVRAARRERPDVFVPIDFPDFNLVLARALKRLGVPIVYYISPQLWAWRRGRVRTIRRLVDRMLVIFPFEAPFYEQAGVPVSFVGHPLVELTPAVAREGFLQRHGLDAARPVVALLPGSRRNEVHAMLPDLVRAGAVMARRLPGAQFVVARAPHLSDDLFAALDAWPVPGSKPIVLEGHTDEILAAASVALVASGTATVQAALHGCPMVVVYRVAASTYRLGKRFVHVDTFAMVNLIAGRKVVPELIQDAFTPERAAAEALRLLTDDSVAARMRADLADIRARLGGRGASRRAAEEIIAIARRTQGGSPDPPSTEI